MMEILKRRNTRTIILMLILAAVSLILYGRALGHQFLINWDDRQYVLDNVYIRGITLGNIKNAFTSFYIGNYAPLHLISYMFDYQVWGLKSSGFILTNILLHTLNGLLFYHLLSRLAGERVWTFPAVLIFLLHPVQVESVVWISQRKNLLAMLFFLAALIFYQIFRANSEKYPVRYYFLSLGAFLLAILAKSVVVILPLVLLLLDLNYLVKREWRRLIIDMIPFLIISVVFSLVAVQSQELQFQGGRTSWHGGSPYATFLTMLTVMVSYLRLLIWPSQLSAFYDVPISTSFDMHTVIPSLVCLLLLAAGVLIYKRKRELFFWYALFFIGLIPVSQVVPIVTLINDRYLYFPMLGAAPFLALIAFGDAEWSSFQFNKRTVAGLLVLTAFIGVWTFFSFQRVGVWENSATLWGDAAEKSPRIALVHDSYGEGLLEQGKLDDAIVQFKIALNLQGRWDNSKPDQGEMNSRANTHNNLGTAYGMKWMTDAAIEQFNAAISLNPGFAKAYYNLGNGLMQKGDYGEALRCFETAVRLEPANPVLVNQLMRTRELLMQKGG
jgi:tetratricopeptide (TPR) repeat protein